MKRIKDNILGIKDSSFAFIRKLYDWTLSWAYTKYGTLALFILAFSESSFFPIPPDVLLIALSVSRPRKSYWYAAIAIMGSVIGGIFGYLLGLVLYDTIGSVIINGLGYEHYFTLVGEMYANNAFWSIIAAALTPIPYKVFTLAAGFWSINFYQFILASLIGRSIRFFLVGTMIFLFGAKIKEFIDKYFNLLTVAFFLLLVLGFVVIKYVV